MKRVSAKLPRTRRIFKKIILLPPKNLRWYLNYFRKRDETGRTRKVFTITHINIRENFRRISVEFLEQYLQYLSNVSFEIVTTSIISLVFFFFLFSKMLLKRIEFSS